jgi:hypothetical protein
MTTFQSDIRLTAVIPAQLITAPGPVSATVVNPGQLISNAVIFTIIAGGKTSSPLAIATPAVPPNRRGYLRSDAGGDRR